jgi:S-adenosylmethionine/arginine decarboxylase-like enzyme
MTEKFWGYHLRLNCKACDKAAATDPKLIADYAKVLVQAIKMVPFEEPRVIHFGEDDLAGYTLLQFIETSNIMAHFNDVSGDAYIDVFSCMFFDLNVAMEVTRDFFNPERISYDFATRQA